MRPLISILVAVLASFASAADKPNFIVILVDDLGYGDLAELGSRGTGVTELGSRNWGHGTGVR